MFRFYRLVTVKNMEANKKQRLILEQCAKSFENDGSSVRVVMKNNEEIRMSKSILLLYSPFLSSLLASVHGSFSGKEPTIIIPDMDAKIMSQIRDLLYSGKTAVHSPALKVEDIVEIQFAAKMIGCHWSYCSFDVTEADDNIAGMKVKKEIPDIVVKTEPEEFFEHDIPTTENIKQEMYPNNDKSEKYAHIDLAKAALSAEEEPFPSSLLINDVINMEGKIFEEAFEENLAVNRYEDKKIEWKDTSHFNKDIMLNEVKAKKTTRRGGKNSFHKRNLKKMNEMYEYPLIEPPSNKTCTSDDIPGQKNMTMMTEVDFSAGQFGQPNNTSTSDSINVSQKIDEKKITPTSENKCPLFTPQATSDVLPKSVTENDILDYPTDFKTPSPVKDPAPSTPPEQEQKHRSHKEEGELPGEPEEPSRSKRPRLSVSQPPGCPAPVTQVPAYQYIYDTFSHDLCGRNHRRIDDCRGAPAHKICGSNHSDFKSCDGSWLPLERFEGVAHKLEAFKSRVTGRHAHTAPSPELGRSISNKLPVSKLPELQYVYRRKYHKVCGKVHSRIDMCEKTPVHSVCGRRHGYAIDCDGSWMSLARFESLALRWPSTIANISKLERQSYKLGNRTRSATLEAKERTKVHTKESTKESTKLRSLCLGWNLTGSCSKETAGDCPHVHRCSYMIIGDRDRVCWGRHQERDHHAFVPKQDGQNKPYSEYSSKNTPPPMKDCQNLPYSKPIGQNRSYSESASSHGYPRNSRSSQARF